MKFTHLLAIIGIFFCTCIGWGILGSALALRTNSASTELLQEVTQNWGPPLRQAHPSFYFLAPNAARTRKPVLPETSDVQVALRYSPKSKGLMNYRTYQAQFSASYTIKNPTPIAQVIYGTFTLPDAGARFDAFSLKIGERVTDKIPTSGSITESIELSPGGSTTVAIAYTANGMDTWRYEFDGAQRVRGFKLEMVTSFAEINFPGDTASADPDRVRSGEGLKVHWNYNDVIGARAIGMDMPKVMDAGPVATRIAFYAPVSLLFYFTVLLILALTNKVVLHPMHWFFLAAGCFAFQLLFAYSVDLVPALVSFIVAACVSLLLVTLYLAKVAGARFARAAAVAQFAYMVLFSYSFFFDGITGLTITVGAVITLAILMIKTAGTDWSHAFGARQPV